MPGSMNQYPTAGAGLAGEKLQAGAGMRNLREDMFQRMRELQQRGGRTQTRDAKRDSKMGMISSGLQGVASLPFGQMFGGGGSTMPGMVAQAPQAEIMNQTFPSYLPPEMMPERFRQGFA